MSQKYANAVVKCMKKGARKAGHNMKVVPNTHIVAQQGLLKKYQNMLWNERKATTTEMKKKFIHMRTRTTITQRANAQTTSKSDDSTIFPADLYTLRLIFFFFLLFYIWMCSRGLLNKRERWKKNARPGRKERYLNNFPRYEEKKSGYEIFRVEMAKILKRLFAWICHVKYCLEIQSVQLNI